MREELELQRLKIEGLQAENKELRAWQEEHMLDNALAYKRIAKLEGRDKEISDKTEAHLKELKNILLARQKSGIKFLSYHDASEILELSPQRIRQLGELAANDRDLGINVMWHPKKKNAKVFILK